jgi:hypothetical protein
MLDLELPRSRPPRPVDLGGPADPRNLLPIINGGPGQTVSPTNETTLQGARLWSLIGGLYLAVYLVGLDLSMLSTVGATHQTLSPSVGTDTTCSR